MREQKIEKRLTYILVGDVSSSLRQYFCREVLWVKPPGKLRYLTLLNSPLLVISQLSLFIAYGPQFFYYFCSITRLQAKTVVTFDDNGSVFHSLARELVKRGGRFVSIQNGSRANLLLREKNALCSIFHDVLVVFGEYEVDWYRDFGVAVNRFITTGSPRLHKFLKESNSLYVVRFDLCIVSNYKCNPDYFDEYKFSLRALSTLVTRWRLKVVVALRTSEFKDQEYIFMRELFPCAELVLNRRGCGATTYASALSSSVSIGLNSSVIKELLSIGAFACSLYSGRLLAYRFPVEGWFCPKNVDELAELIVLCREARPRGIGVKYHWGRALHPRFRIDETFHNIGSGLIEEILRTMD